MKEIMYNAPHSGMEQNYTSRRSPFNYVTSKRKIRNRDGKDILFNSVALLCKATFFNSVAFCEREKREILSY